MEMARGSLIVDKKTNYVGVNNRVSVGKGGIVFAPFLDLNCNNRREPGEPKAYGLNIRINGGTATKSDRDTTVRVMDLEPYTNYLVELDANSFDNVAWKIHNKVLSIVVDPNSLKLVEIPVAVVGEVSGMVYKEKGGNQEGLGRIIVNIFNPDSQLAGKTLSEQDGYYSYMGLAPGNYEVKVDSTQLKKLHLLATPEKKTITIKKNRDGDIVEGIDFSLKSTLPATIDSTYVAAKKPAPAVNTQQPIGKINDFSQQNIASQPLANLTDLIYLQVGAFRSRNNARKMATSLAATIHYPTVVAEEGGWYKVWFGSFANNREADLCKNAIVSNGILAGNLIQEVNIKSTENIQPQTNRSLAQSKAPTSPTNNQSNANQAGKIVTNNVTPQPVIAYKEANPLTYEVNKEVTLLPNEATPLPSTTSKVDNILKRHYYVQIGAFIVPKNATSLIKKISHLLPYSVGIVYRDQFYKVRYGPFETQDELNDCIRLIVKAGIMQKELLKIFYEEIGSTPIADQPHLFDGYHVQIGAFRDKANATRYFKKMSAEYPYPILMIEEDGYYKVRFGPYKTLSDTQKCRKAVAGNGVDCFMRSNTVKYF
jgi:cell division protein FtsN